MNVACIIQARMGSTRLPGKILLPLQGKPMLHHVIDRVNDAKTVTQIVIATTTNPPDQAIADVVTRYSPKTTVFRGSEDDLLDRYTKAARMVRADIVVRVTSDCPLIDPEILDQLVLLLLNDPSLDYASNVLGELTYPRGLDVQAVRMSVLERIWSAATEPEDREHVTLYIRKHPDQFNTAKITLTPPRHEGNRWTVDEDADYRFVKEIYARLYPTNPKFRMRDVFTLLEREPDLAKINAAVEQKLAQY